jgi:hypothetical protein
MLRPIGIAALVHTLVACGGPPQPSAPEVTTTSPAGAATATTEAAPPAASSAAAPADAKPTTAAKPSEEKLRASKSLDSSETPFPEIEAVTKELGPPSASGKASRRQWRYDTRPLGKSASCDTIDLIRTPSGALVVDTSVLTSTECKKVKATKAQVSKILDTLVGSTDPGASIDARVEDVQGKKFDEAAALFEKQLGKAPESGEPALAAWRYVADDETCRMVVITSHLGSGAGQAIWGVPCE